jgi:hypothetical protein
MAQQSQVKFIKVQSYEKYLSAVKTYPAAIIFGEFTTDAAIADASAAVTSPISLPAECGFLKGTKLIYANGIQYDVTNLTKFSEIDSSIDYLDSSLAALYDIVNGLNIDLGNDFVDLSTDINDLSTYVHTTVDGSISDISTKLVDLSTYVRTTVDGSISDISTKLVDLSTYVRTTVDGSISDISTKLAGALTNASLYVETGTDSSVKISLVTNTVANTSLSTDFKVNGSDYVNVQYASNAVKVSLQNVTNGSNDIDASSNKLVKADDLYNYVSSEISNLEGALQFKGGVADASALSNITTKEKGDVYVATGDFTFDTHNVESGDLLIYGESDWVIVERNLDGAVEATDTLTANKVVVGNGNHTVKTTDFVLPDVDNSTGIKNASANSRILTTQYAVRDYVDKELADKVAGVRVSVSTGTKEYVEVSVNENTGEFFETLTSERITTNIREIFINKDSFIVYGQGI